MPGVTPPKSRAPSSSASMTGRSRLREVYRFFEEAMDKRYGIIPYLFWVGLSIFAMVGSYKLELGRFNDPGAGLVPFLLGALLFILSGPRIIKLLWKRPVVTGIVEKEPSSRINLFKIASVSASLFAYCILLKRLGYLVDTTLLLVFLFKTASSKKWPLVVAISMLTAVVSYFGFTLLGLRFPRGIFGV